MRPSPSTLEMFGEKINASPGSSNLRLFSRYRQRSGITAIPKASVQQALEKYNGDIAKTKAFEIEKPAQPRTTLRDPAHQLAV